MQLARLTYVYDGDPGTLGRLLGQLDGNLRFGEGSGLFDLDEVAGRRSQTPSASRPAPPNGTGDIAIRVTSVNFAQLSAQARAEIGAENVPCMLGHAGTQTVVLLPPRSIARLQGSLSDLRGKVRYALARIEWTL